MFPQRQKFSKMAIAYFRSNRYKPEDAPQARKCKHCPTILSRLNTRDQCALCLNLRRAADCQLVSLAGNATLVQCGSNLGNMPVLDASDNWWNLLDKAICKELDK